MRHIDLRHVGHPRVICCWEHDGILIDPGPESCVATLLDALGDLEPRAILLTHIHFDHAGATGTLAKRFPGVPIHVHERGARHLADPSRLVASATRLYGEEGMRRLWGEVVPVPAERLHVLRGGEAVLGHRVAYTPGHASHHVCFFHEDSGHVFAGDMAGVRIPPADLVLAPTPPPDIDVAAWEASLDVLAAWGPDVLCLTHFGPVAEVEAQLAGTREALHAQARRVAATSLEAYIAETRRDLRARLDPATADTYERAVPLDHIWLGLDRWRSRQSAATA